MRTARTMLNTCTTHARALARVFTAVLAHDRTRTTHYQHALSTCWSSLSLDARDKPRVCDGLFAFFLASITHKTETKASITHKTETKSSITHKTEIKACRHPLN